MISAIKPVAVPSVHGASGGAKLEYSPLESGDGTQFRTALERHAQANRAAPPAPAECGERVSLGDKIMGRATEIASEVKQDQQYVSKMLEQATRTGDSMQLMKAMLALNDYQTRVQFVSKTVSKATSSLDQLTKLQ